MGRGDGAGWAYKRTDYFGFLVWLFLISYEGSCNC